MGDAVRICATIRHMDALDRRILALLVEDGRRTYDDIGRRVSLSAPSVKRRVDRLRSSGALEAWSVTGEADAIARVRTEDNTCLERLIMELQRHGLVVRRRSEVAMSRPV